MKIDHIDCIPCFSKQALYVAKISGADERRQSEILNEVDKLIPQLPPNTTPPEAGRLIHKLIREMTGINDPFKKIQEESNKIAMEIYPRLRVIIETSQDRLLTAVELAIAGNIIDYGAKNTLDIDEEIKRILDGDFASEKAVFDYQGFRDALAKVDEILYLGDNAGETVFDKLLIEEMKVKVAYVVRGGPAINDALVEDARTCGIEEVAEIVSNGSDVPGTVLRLCSEEFLGLYKNAGMIISKGQGNFETLSGEKNAPIFFLLKAKCPVVAGIIGCEVGDIILRDNLKG